MLMSKVTHVVFIIHRVRYGIDLTLKASRIRNRNGSMLVYEWSTLKDIDSIFNIHITANIYSMVGYSNIFDIRVYNYTSEGEIDDVIKFKANSKESAKTKIDEIWK